MKFKKLETKFKERVFVIDEDMPEVGTYLYVFENGQCVFDYLQDNIEMCKFQAFEDFGVPYDSWENVNANKEDK